MRKLLLILVFSAVLWSCKETQNYDELPTYSGEYIYTEEGAVLKGNNYIYGVTLDETAKQLADSVAPIKKDEFDMIPVIVKGIVEKNPAEGAGETVWPEIITIKKIVEVGKEPAKADVRIGEKTEQ
ncbi:MAG: hypothetical protein MK211_07850 [Flavobacteriales bacterium]|jgi:hypothetical protein|uniref:hypothetical protein n=1 Tax=Candidatus Ulvibacter alkanivorans TaxID=2267620 RepID=UPI000DF25D32|nr:hypothetical protein [Candidatus Ulvibacter alkanivorans]MCH2490047.1 hypothetical protein [Flavobacteriales bacterium]